MKKSPSIDTPFSASALMSLMTMLCVLLFLRLTLPRKSLLALSRMIAPAPALMVTAPVPETIAPVCVSAPLLRTSSLPSPNCDTLPSTSALMSVMAMLFAPVLASVTAPMKSFPVPSSRIAAAPAVTRVLPPTASTEPLACITAPLVVMARLLPMFRREVPWKSTVVAAFSVRLGTVTVVPSLN